MSKNKKQAQILKTKNKQESELIASTECGWERAIEIIGILEKIKGRKRERVREETETFRTREKQKGREKGFSDQIK